MKTILKKRIEKKNRKNECQIPMSNKKFTYNENKTCNKNTNQNVTNRAREETVIIIFRIALATIEHTQILSNKKKSNHNKL